MSQKIFARVLRSAEAEVARGGRVALCQIVRVEGSTPGKAGWKMMVKPGGEALGNLGGGAFEALVQADAARLLTVPDPAAELKRYYFTEEAVRGEPTGMVCGGMAEVFLEVMKSNPVLVVCGGGPVGQALASAGDLAGFDVLVAEDRDEFSSPRLFPEGTEIERVDRGYGPDFLGAVAERDLYVCIVTRCWETDVAALSAVLRQAPAHLRYLGLMGSHRKVERVKEEVSALGQDVESLTLHAPIGLSLGGDSPGEIAIAIVAQVLEQRYAGRAAEQSSGPRRVEGA
jgi:xanthine dehydrogenase accessory factor